MKKTLIIFLCNFFGYLIFGSNAIAQRIIKDRPYKFGDFMIVLPDTMKIDYIIKGKPLMKRISKGDTLYEDDKCLILGNSDVLLGYGKYGIFKKYTCPHKFSSFEVPVYKGKLSSPKFKTDAAAWLFRTQIREQCKSEGINFAGHYTIVKWGCGSNCLQIALIDRLNGKITFSDILIDKDESFYTIDFKKKSKIVILNDWLVKYYKGYIFCSENWDIIDVSWENTKFRVLSATKFNDHPANP